VYNISLFPPIWKGRKMKARV